MAYFKQGQNNTTGPKFKKINLWLPKITFVYKNELSENICSKYYMYINTIFLKS